MSYILDALRRAEAERERGEVPSLHTQQYLAASDEAGPGKGRLAWWAGAGLIAVLIALLVWKLLAADPPPPSPSIAPATMTALPPAPTPPPIFPASPATVETNPRAGDPPRPARVETASPAEAIGNSAATTKAAARAEPAKVAPARADAAKPEPPKVEPANSARIYAQSELPDDVRRGLPPLNVGGASYSSDPASRMVIINGQVLHEGDRVAEGLVLKQIKLRSAVLAVRTYRFEINF